MFRMLGIQLPILINKNEKIYEKDEIYVHSCFSSSFDRLH